MGYFKCDTKEINNAICCVEKYFCEQLFPQKFQFFAFFCHFSMACFFHLTINQLFLNTYFFKKNCNKKNS